MLAATALAAGCAARGPRRFPAAGAEEARQALLAWSEAVSRGASLSPSRLLYDARFGQGLFQSSGTLAVVERGDSLSATLTGPFGAVVARYGGGVVEAQGAAPLPLDGGTLRAILAGVWMGGTPRVAGCDAGDCLLRWEETEPVEAVLQVAAARLRTLRLARHEGEILAAYSGAFAPWPERIEAEELRSGRKLRLHLLAREPLFAPGAQGR